MIDMAQRFLDSVHGQVILRAAIAALDTHVDIAKEILQMLSREDHTDQGASHESPLAPDDLHTIDRVQQLLMVPNHYPRIVKRRVAYTATTARVPEQVITTLSPAQRKILAALVKSPRPLDVSELTTSCSMQKKTVTNALSMLKGRALIGTQEKKS